MYDMKALYQAASVEEAVALRLEHPEAQIIAGGSDVLVQMREGKRAGAELISIYDRRQHLQRRDLRRFRLHPPRVGRRY